MMSDVIDDRWLERNPREGWARDSQRIVEAGEEALVWPEFGNEDDRSTRLNTEGSWPALAQFEHQEAAMATMIISGKRQVVLPAELCRQVSLAPGARVRVELAPNGDGILVRSAGAGEEKPASDLFDRIARRGKPLSVDDLQGLAVAKKQGKP